MSICLIFFNLFFPSFSAILSRSLFLSISLSLSESEKKFNSLKAFVFNGDKKVRRLLHRFKRKSSFDYRGKSVLCRSTTQNEPGKSTRVQNYLSTQIVNDFLGKVSTNYKIVILVSLVSRSKVKVLKMFSKNFSFSCRH